MYALVLFGTSLLIVVLLAQVNGILALFFFLAAVAFIPGLLIHRRELAASHHIQHEHDSESTLMTLARLGGVIGLDTTGIALGVLLIILGVLFVRLLAQIGIH